MRWYFNDASLQGQFAAPADSTNPSAATPVESFLAELLAVRPRIHPLRVTRTLATRQVNPGVTLRAALQQSRKADLRRQVFVWLDRTGPFMEDDRLYEVDDLFEYRDLDVTYSGLGEAARRVKAGEQAHTFSVPGGIVSFAVSSLDVDHGLREERLGVVPVPNVWTIPDLLAGAANDPPIVNWRVLIEVARLRFPRLVIPDSVHQHKMLAREPYSDVIGTRVLTLLGHLNAYMAGRGPDGAEGPAAREIVRQFFEGDRAAFSGESEGNQNRFRSAMTFPAHGSDDETIFAHWHGKISYRVFRLHFEWPVPQNANVLRVVYLGPKLTKD